MAVQIYLLINDAGITPEAPLPVTVAQHDHWMGARRAVVIRREQPADGRPYAQHVEEVSGNQLCAGALRLAVIGEADGSAGTRDHAAEDLIAVAQVPVHRIGKDGLHVVARTAAAALAIGVKNDKALWIRHRQITEHHLAQQRENRRVRADTERERQYGDDRENRTAAQRSEPKAEIIPHGAIVSPQARSAVGYFFFGAWRRWHRVDHHTLPLLVLVLQLV